MPKKKERLVEKGNSIEDWLINKHWGCSNTHITIEREGLPSSEDILIIQRM